MYISRIVIRNFRNFSHFDVRLNPGVTCILGENNTGKTNLIRALRLVLDSDLSSQYRRLIEHDIFSGVDISKPNQVIVSAEFSDFADKANECALVGCWEVNDHLARLNYRFRPSRAVREQLEAGERDNDLSLDDYHWEMTGGGEKRDCRKTHYSKNLHKNFPPRAQKWDQKSPKCC
jgi:putative ATP-dependent endonuclease of the OLD family